MDNRDVHECGQPMGKLNIPFELVEQYIQQLNQNSVYLHCAYLEGGKNEIHLKRLHKGFKKEKRYIVFKLNDLDCLTQSEKEALNSLVAKVAESRKQKGKMKLGGVFIESDWKCYSKAWTLVAKEFDDDAYQLMTEKLTPKNL